MSANHTKGKRWTPADDAQLRHLYGLMPLAAIAKSMGRTYSAVQSRIVKKHIGRPQLWSQSDTEQLIALYPDTDNDTLAILFGRTAHAVAMKAYDLGLKKCDGYMSALVKRQQAARERTGCTVGRFIPGQKPWNKGLKGWCAPGTEKSQFKPGNRPHTWQPLGHEVVRKGYLWRKITDDGPPHKHYRPVHVLTWEAAHGPVPPGHIVVFRDRDDRTQNITLDRLELISRAENMRRNAYQLNYPPEIRGAIAMRARLTRVINEKTRQLEQTP